jgi:hypothetical protein
VIPQGVIDEQTKRWGELLTPMKINSIASRVHWLNRKGRVKNETGMFVNMVREAVSERITAWELSQSPSERERHAAFMVEMLRCARQSSPREVASCIRAARAQGFPQLDGYLMDRLDAMGESWERTD